MLQKPAFNKLKGGIVLHIDFDDTRLVSVAVYNGHPSMNIHELTVEELALLRDSIAAYLGAK
jgi:hypothetical protein